MDIQELFAVGLYVQTGPITCCNEVELCLTTTDQQDIRITNDCYM